MARPSLPLPTATTATTATGTPLLQALGLRQGGLITITGLGLEMLVISSSKKTQGGGDVRVTLKPSRAGQTLPTNSDYVLASQYVIKLVKAKSTVNMEPAYAAACSGAARGASAATPAVEEARALASPAGPSPHP